MNERIQQMIYSLNEKAGVHWINEDKIKFAESIVKECCTVLAKCKEEPFPFDEDYACRLLKIHFGVE